LNKETYSKLDLIARIENSVLNLIFPCNNVFFLVIEGGGKNKEKKARKGLHATETKMKLAWKNNSKKRSLSAISKFPNLPFENQQLQDQHEDEANRSSNTQLNKKENGDEGSASLESSDSSDAKQLAHSFQAQGNKLAEVSPRFLVPSFIGMFFFFSSS
jgi:hypothetical protein